MKGMDQLVSKERQSLFWIFLLGLLLSELSLWSLSSPFFLYLCLLFMYPNSSSLEPQTKKFTYNVLLFLFKTFTLVIFVSYEPSFWLCGWLYFNIFIQILNSVRCRPDTPFIFGRKEDEVLTVSLPIQLGILAVVQLKGLLRTSPSTFWNFVIFFQWIVFIGFLIVTTLPLIDFYTASKRNYHRNDLVFEIQTALVIFVGIYWIIIELLWILVFISILFIAIVFSLKDNHTNTYQWIKNEDWIGRIYAHFEAETGASRKDKECVVCMENIVNTVLAPCGHICMCLPCANRLAPKNCPICKNAVQNVIRTFDATYKAE